MKIHRERSSNPPFDPNRDSPFEGSPPLDDTPRAAVPTGRQKLSTGLREARLYLVPLHNGGAYWLVEVMRNGAQLSRRFASELHARVWLIELFRPNFTPASFDREEI